MFIYVVEKGDTLYSLAKNFNVTIDDIAILNGIDPNDYLVIGQSLVIPSDKISYVVTFGDSLYKISKMYGVSLRELITANPQITNPNMISVGQVINIPINSFKPFDVVVNGYVLPGINNDILDRTLPYLDYLSIFSYEVMEDGNLRPIMDENYIKKAKNYKVNPWLAITNIGGDGFSSEIAHTIFTNSEIQEILINNIIETATSKGYSGVNVDFEYLFPEDRDLYTAFLQNLNTRLKEYGLALAVAVAPKVSDLQTGLLYSAHDYEAIGRIADIVIIMTYEWGYLYGEPQSISPINRIEEVISYATTVIPSNKILLGVSNYAYDWSLPYVKGTPAMIMSNAKALKLARRVGSNIIFDNVSKSPYFKYVENGKEHIVWFEDARTLYAKLDLVTRYNLLGISYWNINYFINPSGLLVENKK